MPTSSLTMLLDLTTSLTLFWAARWRMVAWAEAASVAQCTCPAVGLYRRFKLEQILVEVGDGVGANLAGQVTGGVGVGQAGEGVEPVVVEAHRRPPDGGHTIRVGLGLFDTFGEGLG
ncbi:MAG: hypothetical protein V9G20_03000 [Candidatus Promineifilaceae bacterium]